MLQSRFWPLISPVRSVPSRREGVGSVHLYLCRIIGLNFPFGIAFFHRFRQHLPPFLADWFPEQYGQPLFG